MSQIREGARQTMAWLHGWTGLLLGYVLFIMCFAGTLSLFKPEISRWMRPETVASIDAADAVANSVAWLGKNAATSSGWYIAPPTDRMNMVEASYAKPEGGYARRAFDPVSGAPVPRETSGGEFFYRLHFELEIPYPWGRMLASLAAAVMLLALITGIIAHRRIFRDFFTFRPGKGQRSWLDAHNGLGVLSLPFHLMITFTGLLTLASVNMPWGSIANYGGDLSAMYRDFSPGTVDREPQGIKAPLAPVAPMLKAAERRFGGPVGNISIANAGDRAAVVNVQRSTTRQLSMKTGEISFDGATGRILNDYVEERPAMKSYGVLYGLHMARFAPGFLRWLYFLGGAMLTLAIGSGLVLWIVKRREKAPLSLANRLLERMNAGVLGGVPVATLAYFWANRLLPLEMSARPQAEVAVSLWTGAACIGVGLALRPAMAWRLFLTLLAIACFGAPLLGNGFHWLTDAVARRDGAIIGTDLVMWATGLVAIWILVSKRGSVPAARPASRVRREQPTC